MAKKGLSLQVGLKRSKTTTLFTNCREAVGGRPPPPMRENAAALCVESVESVPPLLVGAGLLLDVVAERQRESHHKRPEDVPERRADDSVVYSPLASHFRHALLEGAVETAQLVDGPLTRNQFPERDFQQSAMPPSLEIGLREAKRPQAARARIEAKGRVAALAFPFRKHTNNPAAGETASRIRTTTHLRSPATCNHYSALCANHSFVCVMNCNVMI